MNRQSLSIRKWTKTTVNHVPFRLAALVVMTMVLLAGNLSVSQAADGRSGTSPAQSRIGSGTVLEGDKVLAGTQISNEGEVKGDLVMAGQNADMQGTVGGDLLAVGSDLSVSGKIAGSLRSASGNLLMSGTVGRNLTSISGTATLTENSIVNGNLYLAGETAILQGTVMGKVWVGASAVTLSGTFNGDVTVESMQNARETKAKLIILPGTVIKGTLQYKGSVEPTIPADASIGKYSFTKAEPSLKTERKAHFGWKQIVRDLLTVLLLYLVALLLLKLFPGFFTRPARFLQEKPLAAAGVGVAALGVSVATVIMTFIFSCIAIFLFKPVVALIAFQLLTTVLVLFGAFSLLPVSLWIGNLLTRGRGGVPGSLAAGLACLTFTRLLLTFLSGIPHIGFLFAVLLWLFGFAVWLLGVGSILRTVKQYHESAARGLPAVEDHLPIV